jgi:hypothetical protein
MNISAFHFIQVPELRGSCSLKNGVFWDVTPCGSYKNSVLLRSVRRLLFTASVVICHPDEGEAKFLRNVGSYKSHTAERNMFLGSRKQPLREADNLTAICEPFV